MDAPRERWRPLPGWEGQYEVSDLGAVRSLRGANGHGPYRRPHPHMLRFQTSRDGYRIVRLGHRDSMQSHRVHRLVLFAFVGPAPDGHVAGHLNGNRSDNRLKNLRWVTHQENADHQLVHGTRSRGTRHPKCKLTEDQVRAIRRRAHGERYRDLATEFGVSFSSVQAIASGRNWAWL